MHRIIMLTVKDVKGQIIIAIPDKCYRGNLGTDVHQPGARIKVCPSCIGHLGGAVQEITRNNTSRESHTRQKLENHRVVIA